MRNQSEPLPSNRANLYIRLLKHSVFSLAVLLFARVSFWNWSDPTELQFPLLVRMFVTRTKFLNGVVWLLSASQLLLQPASGLLHFGCDAHSHSNAVATETPSVWHAMTVAWHRLSHAHDCQHAHADRSSVESAKIKPAASTARCHSSCCSGTQPEDQDPQDQHRLPAHDAHQCPICQVVFAARLNTVAVQLPAQVAVVQLTDCPAVPPVDMAPRFQLPSRGPPSA